jgi:hypothetical protein
MWWNEELEKSCLRRDSVMDNKQKQRGYGRTPTIRKKHQEKEPKGELYEQ